MIESIISAFFGESFTLVGNPAPPIPTMPASSIIFIISSLESSSGLPENIGAASSYIPSFSTIMESTIPPVATSLFSIALTVPDTEECMLADINPPFSAIFCPTRTLSPALTSGLAIAPICWDNGYTRVSPGLSISMGHSLDIFFPS